MRGMATSEGTRRALWGAATLEIVLAVALCNGLAASAQGAPTWLAPEVLAGKSWTSGSNPNLVADSRGDAFAAWAHRPEFNGDSVIETSIKPGGSSTWQAPVRLSSGGEDSEWPVLAVDAAGDVTAVWEGRNGTESDIEAAVRPAGSGTWTAPVQLATDTGKYGGPPELAVDPEGDAVAVWAHENGAGSDVIEASSKPHGSETWQVPVPVSAGGDLAGSPHVAMDANGDAFVVWQRWGNCDRIESAIRAGASGAWQAPVALSGAEGTECASSPRVAVDPQGDAIATWQNDKGAVDFGTVEADLRPANSSAWDAPVALSGPGVQAQEPRVALNALDEAIVVWSSVNGDENRIEATARPQTTGAWQAPVTLSSSPVREPNIGEFAQVAIDAQGDAFAAWDQSNGSDYVIDTAGRPAATGVWQTPEVLSPPSENAYVPSVAMFPQGDAVATWEVQAENATVEAAGYDGGGPIIAGLEVPSTGTVGQPVSFSASPLAVWSALGFTDWSFGDGAGASGTSVTHVYTTPGDYTVTLNSVDALDNLSSASATIAISPTPAISSTTKTPPALTDVSLANRRFRVGKRATAVSARETPLGTSFHFTLSAVAKVQITISRSTPGLRKGHSCRAPSSKLERANAKRCTRTLTVGALTRASEAKGADSIPFSGRIGHRALSLGAYTATLGATNAAGRSKPVTLRFTIVR
jgi:hypothetical protein